MIALEIKNLKFKYPGQIKDFLDIKELKINKGSKVFIQGSSGSGKSTLLNLIGGVLPFSQGEITVLGQNLKKLNLKETDLLRGNRMGFIFQQFNLIPYLSVYENIKLPLDFSEQKKESTSNYIQEIERLTEALQISRELFLKKPYELSVGQQQRVAAARALLGNPELIIADEPTSSLDYEARDSFLKALFEQVERTHSTLLFVSHDLSLKNHFDSFFEIKRLS